MRLVPLGLLEEFPSEEENGENSHHQVAEQEVGHIPEAVEEDRVSANERHDHGTGQGIPCRIWLPERRVR